MDVNLEQILSLVGNLNDSMGDDASQSRFRNFLYNSINEIVQIRDYVEECTRKSEAQYNKALQDLIVYIGKFLDFEFEYGRYRGVQGEIGYDGIWTSKSGDFNIVIEVKTSETYPISTPILIGYIDELISQQKITDWDHAMGLYVVARPVPEIRQLENSIIAERRIDKLRVISADNLLSLAELMLKYDITQEDILALLRPSGPKIDPIVEILTRLVASDREIIISEQIVGAVTQTNEEIVDSNTIYWLTPIRSSADETVEKEIERLLIKNKFYAFGERTPGRSEIKQGDKICFYASGKGTMAFATVASSPIKKSHPAIKDPERYPWLFDLIDPHVNYENPIAIDSSVRAKLDAFKDKDPNTTVWSWFVQSTRKISENDFKILTSF